MRTIALVLALVFSVSSTVHAADPAIRVYSGLRTDKVVALTFDDCYRTANVSSIVAILRQQQATATFFCAGHALFHSPSVFADLASTFPLANHTWDHPDLNIKTPEEITSQMALTRAVLEEVTGRPEPTYMRPPYGRANRATRQVLGDLGYSHVILWDIDTRDWTGITELEIRDNALRARNGSIILMHDRTTTVAALPRIIRRLRKRGFQFVSVEALLAQLATPTV